MNKCLKITHIFLFGSFITLFLLVGCWDRKEINDIAIVTSTAIDAAEDGEIELSVEIIIPEAMSASVKQGGGGGDRSTFVESATGLTIADARSKLQTKVARTLFWGHSEATVIGKKLAEKGIKEHLDFFARMPDTRLRNAVYVTEEKAKDIISGLPHLEDTAAETLKELGVFQSGLNITMKDLYQMLKNETRGAALPIIKAVKSKEDGKIKNKTQLNMEGSALFKKDKMVGSINEAETRGLLWVINEIRMATVTIVEEDEGKISLEMIRSHTELIPQIKDGTWKMMVKVITEDDIIQNGSKLDVRNPEIIKKLEQKVEKDIEDRMNEAVYIAQKELKTDVLNFGEAFRRKFPKELEKATENWDEQFQKIEVDFDIKVNILRPGEVVEPPTMPKKEVKKQ